MADVRPFRGTHYNPQLLGDWAKVICPVYDIIPPGQHEHYYGISPYNFVRLEAGRDLPQDSPSENKYTRAKANLGEWLSKDVLTTDEVPAFYLHQHQFFFAGREYSRLALIARVRLEDWDKKVIRPHESTFADARSDRLSLLWAVEANTSSILGIYQDTARQVQPLFSKLMTGRPFFSLPWGGGEAHRVWAVTETTSVNAIANAMRNTPIYIADGHHRYESALAYSKQKKNTLQSSAELPSDFVMMTLVEFNDPGLLILPPHRLVRGISKSAMDTLPQKLAGLFDIEKVTNSNAPWDKIDKERLTGRQPALVVFGLEKEGILLLRPKDIEAMGSMMPQFHSNLYRTLEVSIIDHVLLENMLGIAHEKDKVGYSHELADAVVRVENGEYQLAFLVRPITAETIKAVADLDDKMPKKSTYFYPKVPAGLIINRFIP